MIAHLRQAVSGRFKMLEGEAAKLSLDLNQAQAAFQALSAQVEEKETGYTQLRGKPLSDRCWPLTTARRVAELNLETEWTPWTPGVPSSSDRIH